MDKKVAIFAFHGEMMCFAHALLNALDMKEKGAKCNHFGATLLLKMRTEVKYYE